MKLFIFVFSINFNVNAQETNQSVNEIEEILVTAQRAEENIQDVGIAITALTGNQLEALGMTTSLDIIAQTPGLEATGAGGGVGATSFAIRGVAQNDFSSPQESPVAIYIDQSYIASPAMSNFSLFDLERVEVLKTSRNTVWKKCNRWFGSLHLKKTITRQRSVSYTHLTLPTKA